MDEEEALAEGVDEEGAGDVPADVLDAFEVSFAVSFAPAAADPVSLPFSGDVGALPLVEDEPDPRESVR